MGEKFSANPVTGTGSMSVPIFTSPGRSGFGPQLSLSYDSGAGNGLFGWGWSLSVPSITRKTDKGLPRYRDAEASDVFILSGAEDLVPALKEVKKGEWKDDVVSSRKIGNQDYEVRRYRPRTEGLFARIERWSNNDKAKPEDTFWRSISKDNITTWYGKTTESRIFDPADPARVFSWLICESYDDKGNAVCYEYVHEDEDEDPADVDLTQAHERNRTNKNRSSNRYLKRVKYGNRSPNRDVDGKATDPTQLRDWMFEVVFDYGERHYEPLPDDAEGRQLVRASKDKKQSWTARQDPFSTYRAGFEVRTYRLCRRVLMFHHFPNELGTDDYLVRSTEFTYKEDPIASFITQITQSGYLRKKDGTYLKKSLPPLEFEYSQASVQEEVREVDPESLENLPYGLDGTRYQWLDLVGEGISGILTEQGGAWFYKRNLSPLSTETRNGQQTATARFGPIETVAQKPSLAGENGGGQFLDLAGDGSLDFVRLGGPAPGFYERTDEDSWDTFTPFEYLPVVDWEDPNLRFVDLTGDGHADVLITEGEVFTWHPSLAEAGFGPEERTRQPFDEERGPRLVFADGTQSIHLADCSGDGLTDLVRIRNGEVCYWPNLGYGRFGHKVTMDNSPLLDMPDLFEGSRVRLADIDGSGVTDIIYLGNGGVRLHFNRSGNSWSDARTLTQFPRVDDFSSVTALDLLGNGTACLVWSSSLPAAARCPMRYVDLMGSQKPHLLVGVVNNLGTETRVKYAPSTRFYQADKIAGKPWITKLPFPVHVVEQVETHDRIGCNRFVTCYAYHHGYFDGADREFRGFGMVEQWDTEEIGTVTPGETSSEVTNLDAASYAPPVLTKTWFHTGAYLGRDHISDFFAGLLDGKDVGEYYREPGIDDEQARELLLDDTELPAGLTVDEEPEACRALKGSMLRQEVYALDGTNKEKHPYTVTEQNFTIRRLQPQAENRHAVFLTHPREAIKYHYERLMDPADPRVTHALTLEVDDFGNVLRWVAIGYPRRAVPGRVKEQEETHITFVVSRFVNRGEEQDWYRAGLPVESRTYEVAMPPEPMGLFEYDKIRVLTEGLLPPGQNEPNSAKTLPYEAWDWRENGTPNETKLRLIQHVRTLYRKNDLTGLLGLGTVMSLALPGETYKLAFTPGLLTQVYQRSRDSQPPENLLPDPAAVLPADVPGGQVADRGGYVISQTLRSQNLFPANVTDPFWTIGDADGHWWLPAGRTFYSPNSGDTAAVELTNARKHFFVPRRYRDSFGQDATVTYDAYDLLMVDTRDPLGNRVTAGERAAGGAVTKPGNDYRVLQPRLVSDPNRNRAGVAFDALGMVVGTAVMGKPPPEENLGDSLDGFESDLTQAQIDGFYEAANPHGPAVSLLKDATTRIICDLHQFQRTQEAHPDDPSEWQPVYAATVARETHVSDPPPADDLKVQISFAYSDGFGREIQKKIQAEPGPLVEGGPTVSQRWVGSAWTIFNNKGKPVRQYEPFFSQLPNKRHQFEFGVQTGVSPILFYDPVERVVATLHPNRTYEKVIFDPWRQTTYDVNDTVAANGTETGDPRTDADIKGYVAEYFKTKPNTWQSWHLERIMGAKGAQEKSAAEKAAKHANTPTTTHFDTLGRPFLTLAHNGFKPDGAPIQYPTRIRLDIEGNQREARDAIEQNSDKQGRIVMRYDYDLLGNRIHQASMEAGRRWMLNDVSGKPIYAWDNRGHRVRRTYDGLGRPVGVYVSRNSGTEALIERTVYGEMHPDSKPPAAGKLNLRGKVFMQLDGAGVITNAAQNPHGGEEAYDFKGNLKRSTRRLAREYKQQVSWQPLEILLNVAPPAVFDLTSIENSLAPLVETETFASSTTYDALNHPVLLRTPDGSVIQPTYNEANLLEGIEAKLHGAASVTTFVHDINYNARGQRTRIDYGNAAFTEYEYDEDTFWLVHQMTVRASFPQHERIVQDVSYTYDPAGNITHIEDDADIQKVVFFKNQRVEPTTDYTYDAIYRLIEATGRELLGQTASGAPRAPTPISHTDVPRMSPSHPGDVNAMGRYTQQYIYDEVSNILEMNHRGTDPADPGWTRGYVYNEISQLEPGKKNNRLSSTTDNRLSSTTAGSTTGSYRYDAPAGLHGNMTTMPHLSLMRSDYRDQLQATAQQVINNGGTPETTYYVYDASGQRVRKVTERSVTAQEAAAGKQPTRMKERLYLGGSEVYREYGGNGATVTLERETLHIMDDKQRIALVETRTKGNDGSPKQLVRYQFADHLGSSCLELDTRANVISYEEYYPYGSIAYQAVSSQTKAPKRYCYTGKERDEESGLYYYGARYYAASVGRWVSCDPSGLTAGPNLYLFCSSNPTSHKDRTGFEDELLVRESNLFYDFDHYQPRSEYPELGSKASNLGFKMADENRRKGAQEFRQLPKQREPISLRTTLKGGDEGARKAVGEMLGGRRFSEVTELNELWQSASKKETLSYPEAQANFRKLIAEGKTESAAAVRDALKMAEVEIVPNGKSFRFRLNDAAYRGAFKTAEEIKEFAQLKGMRFKVPGAAALKALGVAMTVAGTAAQALEPLQAAQQVDEASAQLGREVGVPLGKFNVKVQGLDYVPIKNELWGQSFMFDPKKYGPAGLFRIIGDPQEAGKLGVEPGDLIKVADFYWVESTQRWEHMDDEREMWISNQYPNGIYALNSRKWSE
jgi:RHS repeat-associated protein